MTSSRMITHKKLSFIIEHIHWTSKRIFAVNSWLNLFWQRWLLASVSWCSLPRNLQLEWCFHVGKVSSFMHYTLTCTILPNIFFLFLTGPQSILPVALQIAKVFLVNITYAVMCFREQLPLFMDKQPIQWLMRDWWTEMFPSSSDVFKPLTPVLCP